MALLFTVIVSLVWSGINPFERSVWWMEVAPVFLGVGALVLCWHRFPWTSVTVLVVTIFAVVLCVGGHYTYAEVPLGAWVAEALELSRNHYDRLGHFMQGVVPAMMARELLLRCTGLVRGKALFWVVVSIALAISASYELLEWWTALLVDPDAGTAFLGSQGDVWDAQWDMALALTGALFAQLTLGRLHDRQLQRLAGDEIR
ncbi:MAG: putative membrane protein [Pseudohongiellaceae bacterium]